MIQLFTDLISQLTTLARGGMILVAIFVVGLTFFKSRSMVATLTSIVIASIALWFVLNPTATQERLNKDLGGNDGTGTTGAPAVIVAEPVSVTL